MKQIPTLVHGASMRRKNTIVLLITLSLLIWSLISRAQTTTELNFRNPVLKSGQANKEGAIYRFDSVCIQNGQIVDAELKLRKFSRSTIVMNTVDKSGMGWEKALQPEFGLTGLVAANQNWYVDFELRFYKKNTTQSIKLHKVDLTAIDIDGDGLSIREYAVFEKANTVSLSTVTYLQTSLLGVIGQILACGECGKTSPLVRCTNCNGTGMNGSSECGNCKGSGKLHDECDHAYQDPTGTNVLGPVDNFMNLDTSATQVMTVYKYNNVDQVRFRYGARSGNLSSNGAGVRLNSVWFKSFSLAPSVSLPLQLLNFQGSLSNKKPVFQWTVADNETGDRMELERSEDGIEFSTAAIIFTSQRNGVENYAYREGKELANRTYFRLRLINKDNSVSYSKTVVLHGELAKQKEPITLLQNPVISDLSFQFAAHQTGASLINIYNTSGVKIESFSLQLSKGANVISRPLSSRVVRGTYILEVICGEQRAIAKFVR